MEGSVQNQIDELRKYSMPNDDLGIQMIEYHVNRYGIEWVLNDLFNDLDCTRLYNGRRICQTIDITYRHNLGELFYLIDNYDIPEVNDVIKKLLEIHNNNIEYEKINPPIVYPCNNKKQKRSSNKEDTEERKRKRNWEKRQTTMFDARSSRIAGIGKLNIKIK